jgi:hypothetical protein
MDTLETFRYFRDNPKEFDIKTFNEKEDDVVYKKHLSNLLTNSIKVSKDIFPSIAKSIKEVFNELKIENNFSFYVTSDHVQANAACAVMPFSNNPEIILTSKLVELLNEDELKFVIGHEIAHYYYQHSKYPHHSTANARIESLNMLNLARGAEISADRIGFIASASLQNSLRAILKIASGLSEKHISFDFRAYLNQLKELEEIGQSENQLWNSHPNFLIRAKALIWFSMTKDYQKFISQKGGNYDLKEIDEKIDEIINKITGNELQNSNKEVYDRALLWGTLKIYLQDKKFSKDEQQNFKIQFGESRTLSVINYLKTANEISIDKKTDEAFKEAKLLLKSDKAKLINELKKTIIKINKKDMNLLKLLSKLANALGDKNPISL